MQKELNRKYGIFLYMPLICINRCVRNVSCVVMRPILSSSFNSRGQIALVDMQSMSDGNYKFIMNYQDHLTKFCVVESLTSKRAAENIHVNFVQD